jgi:hypothetical protein
MKRITIAVLLGTAALSFTPVASFGAQAQFTPSQNQGYLVDRNGNIVKSARTGHCVTLARQWDNSKASRECQAVNVTPASSPRR